MSQKIKPAAIGLFIVTGLALGVAGVLLFSSSRLFSNTRDVIVYFDQSLNGLNEGAPVKYRGVRIGSVKRVMVRYNQATNDFAMPVILELEEKLLKERLGEPTNVFTEEGLELRIKGGLRASLQTESLVTGVLYVDLRPHPEAPPPKLHQVTRVYPEIPSEPTRIQQLFDNLASLDIKSLEVNLNELLEKLGQAVEDLQTAQIRQELTNVLASVDRLASSPQITTSLKALETTLAEYRALGEKLNQRVDPLADGVTNSLAEASRTLVELRATVEHLRTWLAPDSPLRMDLGQALEEMANAAQSLSLLVDFLNRHPNALITGRRNSKPQP